MRIGLAATFLCVVISSVGYADTLALWTFETSQPTTAGPFSPETGSGSALGSHAGAAVYSSPAGNASAHSFSANGWAVGDYWQFQTSSVGYQGISLEWDQAGSSTGPRDFQLSYSTGGGFTNVGSVYTVLLSSWTSGGTRNSSFTYSVDLSGITALNNAASILFRLTDASTTSIGGGGVASAGTDRVDNFQITATQIAAAPLPTVAGGGLAAMSLLTLNRRRVALV